MKISDLKNTTILNVVLPLIFLSLIFGINHQLIGRILLGILLVAMLVNRKNIPRLNSDFNGTSKLFISLIPWLFTISTSVVLISNVYSGRHGIDFVIFSQAIDNVFRQGKPFTTMIGIEPVNFLGHHFFPALYVIGLAGFLGIPGWFAGIAFTFLSLVLTLYSLYKICRLFKLNRGDSFAILAIFCLHPTIRQGFSFSIHDEVFALGLLTASIRYYLERRYTPSLLLAASLMFFKETFFAYVFIFSILNGLQLYRQRVKEWRHFVVLGACSLAMIILYTTYWHSIFGSSFSALDRIQSLPDFFSYVSLSNKFKLLINILLPTLALALFSPSGRKFVIFGIPFWGACLISNFPDMWKPSNYYMVIPVTLLHIGAIATLHQKTNLQKYFSPLLVTLLILVEASIGQKYRPHLELKAAINDPVARPNSLLFIRPHERVVVSEFDALFLPVAATPIRLWTANRLKPKFDSLLIRKKSLDEAFAQSLVDSTFICYEDTTWIKRCKRKL